MSGDRLLNYTTTIDASKSLGEIVARLQAHGAAGITTEYEDRQPAGIAFEIISGTQRLQFRLPVNVAACFQRLRQQNAQGKIQPRFVTRDQASRVAWRIAKDWVEAQVAIIESGMVRLEQVFLPYMLAGDSGETVFEVMERRVFALPAPKEGSQL
jgi:hypothetical protein